MPYDQSSGPTYEGRFSDGKTAAARDVRVSFTPRGLDLQVEGAGEALVWPYGALETAEPLSSHAIDALVSYRHQPGASLFVPNGSFARKLAEAAPQLTTRAVRRRAAVPWLWAAAGVVALVAVISATQLSPARTIAGMMPQSVRDSLGKQTVSAMTRDRKVCQVPAGSKAVATLSKRLSQSVSGDTKFDIVVVDWGLVNAFATPGNKIVLTRGLIEQAGTPDEVAGVLAHEMGHAIAMHPETGIVRGLGLAAAVELMLGGGGGTVGNIGLLLAQLSYTRQAEAEADETALRLLQDAGIGAEGFGNFFRRMGAEDGAAEKHSSSGGVLDMLRTHPPTGDRIRRVDAANKYPATPALSPAEWNTLKAICASSPG